MRLLCLTILLSIFLISCDKDKNETTIEPTQTKQVKTDKESSVAQDDYKLGVDYFELETPYATDTETQVVVYEFFGYTCPHCFHFEPFLDKWIADKPDYTDLKRVPLNFQPAWAIFQQAFLTAETMGIVDQTHKQLFKALHEEHKRFRTIDELAAWYGQEAGIEKEAFLSTAESFILDSAQRKADNMGFKMQITGTPSLVVNGKYKVSNKIRDKNKTIKVLAYLVNKEAQSMGLITQ
jgi:thiol:disulfide interchange protein DsbA